MSSSGAAPTGRRVSDEYEEGENSHEYGSYDDKSDIDIRTPYLPPEKGSSDTEK
jgi:hypothetical protein